MWANTILDLLFPNICPGCGKPLSNKEHALCLHCTSNLPERLKINTKEINQRFYGRVKLEEAFAYLLFKRKGITQRLLHSIKYQGNTDLALELGRLFGIQCKKLRIYASVDVVIPVPLHKSKLRFRGYNQSALIAKGLAEELDTPFDETSVLRKIKTSTQTKKNRLERWKNVEQIFDVQSTLKDKHVLLIDDVLTTGATLESCASTILESGASGISIGCLAMA